MSTADIRIFDRHAVRLHRERAAKQSADTRFLVRECRSRLVDRLLDVRHQFENVLDLGCGENDLRAALAELGRHPAIVAADSAIGFASGKPRGTVMDEEALPFASGAFDLVLATLTLHWTNDLPGALLQLRRGLKPDGLLIAGLWGGETLKELRESLLLAGLEMDSGAGPRVSPFTDIRDAGGLLQRAGFALPVVDSDKLTVTYADPFALMRDLRGMGETNALIDRPRTLSRRRLFLRAAEIYRERFAMEDGRLPATFQLLTMTAWVPAESQPKPLKPGSAAARLADALKSVEQGAGEKAGPGKA